MATAALASPEFSNFKSKFGKHYANPDEEQYRLQVFSSNYLFIQQHNAEHAKGLHSFTLAVNQFADLTNEEYRQKFLGLKRARSNAAPVDASVGRNPVEFSADVIASVPTSWDWRDHGYTVPVKDQGQCGSCWSFSATAAMESAHFLANGTLLSLSEQLLVDCVNGGADDCNTGGEMHDGYLYVIKAGGDELESSYPYTATSGNKCGFDKSKVVATFSSYKNVTQGDETALQVASAQTVLSIGIDASSIWFQFYSSGVYVDKTCKNGWNDLDHGVAIVGYGADSTGAEYWIVRNSWGASWGLEGHILMARNQGNMCGVATDSTFPLV